LGVGPDAHPSGLSDNKSHIDDLEGMAEGLSPEYLGFFTSRKPPGALGKNCAFRIEWGTISYTAEQQ